ncbi:biotin synthase BioB [Geoalkalibacter halelectricus]|uniref:Biotin synthase n=1 Tax=Geoalkalibacter halelectricus TaxID=2847045 RepID=A0ABY5ZRG7_9BACT|nr:biotin synthase BioB [Geoalkalibacter halelectricus]MDO3379931.1 biotin synthase BioB [Geoalkalibacter halelectricus]UWZ80542.1 biotin synthase BioB [Geoalkalibacter halelectricus]
MNNPLLEKVTAGRPLSETEALTILQARGAALTSILAGAHYLREQAFGNRIELCSIINAKSGRCAENCSFCAQSAHHRTTAPVYPLKSEDELVAGALAAAAASSHCYGIVTSGTTIRPGPELDRILAALRRIRQETPIEPSASLGLLDEPTAQALAAAGCVTYHHNLETARSFFPQVCTTHDYEQDVETVRVAKRAGMKVCCGGIFGLGESLEQRVELAMTLRDLAVDSVPLNFLNPVAGTPLEGSKLLTPLDCVRIIALFRYLLPTTRIAVCGGREHNLREFQSWIFMAGASGTMVGNYLTTTGRNAETDLQMFDDAEVQVHAC